MSPRRHSLRLALSRVRAARTVATQCDVRYGSDEWVSGLLRRVRSQLCRDIEPVRDGRGSRAIGYALESHFVPGRTSFARPGSGGVGQTGAPFGCVLLVWRRTSLEGDEGELHRI